MTEKKYFYNAKKEPGVTRQVNACFYRQTLFYKY
jgi:hypothetical protein